jgi:hypothetical protein
MSLVWLRCWEWRSRFSDSRALPPRMTTTAEATLAATARHRCGEQLMPWLTPRHDNQTVRATLTFLI